MVELDNRGLFSDAVIRKAQLLALEQHRANQSRKDAFELRRAEKVVQAMIDSIHKTMIEHDAKQEGSIQVYDGY